MSSTLASFGTFTVLLIAPEMNSACTHHLDVAHVVDRALALLREGAVETARSRSIRCGALDGFLFVDVLDDVVDRPAV
jgi:hypothetical protein